jgi:L-threonylcarbamoyladenylate synthase
MTSHQAIPFWSPVEIENALRTVIPMLHAGKVLAYPTETVYGFGGAADEAGVASLIALKGRPPGKPFLLLVSGSTMLAKLGLHLPSAATRLAARHWPGPLTLVLPGGERRVPERLRGPEGGIAVRWTPHPGLTGCCAPTVSRSRRRAPTSRGYRRRRRRRRLLSSGIRR